MPSTTIKYFAFAHLPPHLQQVSKPIGELADKLESVLPDGPEKSAGMRKLLEAKDCFVRCALDMPPLPASKFQPHQQRVLEEADSLMDKLMKLGSFLATQQFRDLGTDDQDLLQKQHDAMNAYHDILMQRIAGFAGA